MSGQLLQQQPDDMMFEDSPAATVPDKCVDGIDPVRYVTYIWQYAALGSRFVCFFHAVF